MRQRLNFLLNFEASRETFLSSSVEAIQQFSQISITEKLKINEFDHETQTRTTRTIQLNQAIVPLDIDVSPFDNSGSSKEGVSRTYKGHDGYAPNFAYLSTEGFLVNIQLREGKDYVSKRNELFSCRSD